MTALAEWYRSDTGLWLPGPAPEPSRPRAIDLFAGCGGFSLGVEQGGVDVVAAVEWDKWAAATYVTNLAPPDVEIVADTPDKAAWLRGHAGTNERRPRPAACRWFWFDDIRGLTGDIVRAAVGDIDIVIGSPPCQGMSRAGMRKGGLRLDDPRNALTSEYARLVEELRPRAFVMENVPQLYTIGKGAMYDAFEARMAAAGYTVCANLIDCADYGVPQHRRRAIVTGDRDGSGIAMPIPTHWPRIRRPDGTISWIGGGEHQVPPPPDWRGNGADDPPDEDEADWMGDGTLPPDAPGGPKQASLW